MMLKNESNICYLLEIEICKFSLKIILKIQNKMDARHSSHLQGLKGLCSLNAAENGLSEDRKRVSDGGEIVPWSTSSPQIFTTNPDLKEGEKIWEFQFESRLKTRVQQACANTRN